MDIPGRIDEIGPEWLDEVLRPSGLLGSAKITGVDRTYLGEGVGILGELARCRLTYSEPVVGAPEQVIVKLPSAHEANRQRGLAFGFYQREILFYEHIARAGRTGGLRVPRCWHSAGDPASGRFVLVLEDLSGSFRMSDQVAGLSSVEARRAVVELARFHAAWWDTPELASLDWMPASNGPVTMQAAPLYRGLWPVFQDKFGHLLPPGGAEVGAAVGERYEWLLDRIATETNRTIVHTDFRHDNLFFGRDDSSDAPVAVVDWQLSTRGRGIYDVAYLLTQSMEPSERRSSEMGIIRDWHQSVCAGGVHSYGIEEAERDYRTSALVGLVIPVAAGGDMDLGNERGVALVEQITTRAFQAVLDLDAVSVLD